MSVVSNTCKDADCPYYAWDLNECANLGDDCYLLKEGGKNDEN